MRKPLSVPVAAGPPDRSVELVCFALVLALVTLAARIATVL